MQKRLKWANNERLDVPDADAIHELVDGDLRAAGRVLGRGTAQGLTKSGGGSWVVDGVVISGWTCAHNPGDNQQVLITPGVALCAERSAAGVLSYGQVTTPSSAQKVLVIGGALVTKGVWVRFNYLSGDSDNRTRWRPDLSPEKEEVFVHETRWVSDVQIAATDDPAVPPAAGFGWFLISEVDYGTGAIDATKIADRRTLLFEGKGAGTANPATTWDLPDIDGGSSRGTVGANDLHGFAMRVLRKLRDTSGLDKWHYPPNFGETVRSASAAVTTGSQAGGTGGDVHHALTNTLADRPVELSNLLNNPIKESEVLGVLERHRADVQFLLDQTNAREILLLDTTAQGIQGDGTTHRRRMRGPVRLTRSVGTNPILTSNGLVARLERMEFRSELSNNPSILLDNAADDVEFVDCDFTTSVNPNPLVNITSTGRYTFRNCRFVAGAASAGHVSISAACEVRFIECRFQDGLTGVGIGADPKSFVMVGCHFDGAGNMTQALAGAFSAQTSAIGCTVENMVANDDTIGAGDFGGDAVSGAGGSGFLSGVMSAGYTRTRSGLIHLGTGVGSPRLQTQYTGVDVLIKLLRDAAAVSDLEVDRLFADEVGFEPRGATAALGDNALRLGRHAATNLLELRDNVAAPGMHFQRLRAAGLVGSIADDRGDMALDILPRASGLIRRADGQGAFTGWGASADRTALGIAHVIRADKAHEYTISGLGFAENHYVVTPMIHWAVDETGGETLFEIGCHVFNVDGDSFRLRPFYREHDGTHNLFLTDTFDTAVNLASAYRLGFIVWSPASDLSAVAPFGWDAFNTPP